MYIVVYSHAGGSPYHGPNMRWYNIGHHLVKSNVDVTVVSSSFFHKYFKFPIIKRNITAEKIDGIDFLWIRTLKYKKRGLIQVLNQLHYTFKTIVLSLFWKRAAPSIVVASSPHPLVIFPAYILSKKFNCPLIYEIRDLWPEAIKQLSGAGKYHPYILLLEFTERFAVKVADKLVSVKPGDFKYLENKYNIGKVKFSYVQNGLNTHQIDLKNIQPKVLDKSQVVIGYIGALSAYYGLDEFIKAARLLSTSPNIRFVIVGGGDKSENLIDNARDLTNIEFTGLLSRDEAYELLKQFDIAYVGLQDIGVNRYGISCNKIYEYMAFAKPIIGSYITEFDPIHEAECGYTVAPGNAEEIASSIVKLIDNPDRLYKMAKNANAYFLSNHEGSVIAGKYLKLFSEMLEKHEL
jgi:glycosyltransferase involved in cell wall biosynthesis